MEPDQFGKPLSTDDLASRYINKPTQKSTADWAKIDRCRKFEGCFVIDFSSQAFKGSIRFSPDDINDSGFYSLDIPSQKVHEKGEIINVKRVPVEDAKDDIFQGLATHSIRYFLQTRDATSRSGHKRVWLIGIDKHEEAEQ